MSDDRRTTFTIKVDVLARPIADDRYWGRQLIERPQDMECEVHESLGYQVALPLSDWLVTTESGKWLIVDQRMCNACFEQMQAEVEGMSRW